MEIRSETQYPPQVALRHSLSIYVHAYIDLAVSLDMSFHAYDGWTYPHRRQASLQLTANLTGLAGDQPTVRQLGVSIHI